jgi:hypothetical protein
MSTAAHPVPVTTVVVRRERLVAGDLPTAISEFVHDIIRTGAYLPRELPPKAMQINQIGFYVGQVNNGGHAQFEHNSGEVFQISVANALNGLKAMGAEAQHQILTEVVAWAAANSRVARDRRTKPFTSTNVFMRQRMRCR